MKWLKTEKFLSMRASTRYIYNNNNNNTLYPATLRRKSNKCVLFSLSFSFFFQENNSNNEKTHNNRYNNNRHTIKIDAIDPKKRRWQIACHERARDMVRKIGKTNKCKIKCGNSQCICSTSMAGKM